jgi:hypothetical protein
MTGGMSNATLEKKVSDAMLYLFKFTKKPHSTAKII